MQPPWEYTELQLCKEVYHCRPSELDEEDWYRVSFHLDLLNAEGEVDKAQLASKSGGVRSSAL